MLHDRDIIVFAGIDWRFLWQGAQEISTRFARAGNRVLFIENTGVRRPRLLDAGRVAGRIRSLFRARRGGSAVASIEDRLWVHTPLVAPPFGPRPQRALNRILLRRLVARAAEIGMTDPVIITYLPTDTINDAIAMLRGPRSVVVNYASAEFALFAHAPRALARAEETLIEGAELVIATDETLADRFRWRHDNVHVLPHGVSIDAFPVDALSRDAAPFRRPVEVGYIGGVNPATDYELLNGCIAARRDWNWTFVGKVQVAPHLVPRGENVRVIGPVPHAELWRHLERFDVCIVPYAERRENAFVVPTKVNEYLAAGRPVVSTRIPAIVQRNLPEWALLLSDATPAAFTAAIETALAAPDDLETRLKRRAIASRYNWDTTMETLSELIEEAAFHAAAARGVGNAAGVAMPSRR